MTNPKKRLFQELRYHILACEMVGDPATFAGTDAGDCALAGIMLAAGYPPETSGKKARRVANDALRRMRVLGAVHRRVVPTGAGGETAYGETAYGDARWCYAYRLSTGIRALHHKQEALLQGTLDAFCPEHREIGCVECALGALRAIY